MTTAADILRSKADPAVHTVGPMTSVLDAVTLMIRKNIGALVVLENERVVGIVSERDVARKGALSARPSQQTSVRDIMTTSVMVVPPQRSSRECMALMTEHRLRHLPVMDDGRLIGLVSIGDLVKDILAEQQFVIEQLEHYITGQRDGSGLP